VAQTTSKAKPKPPTMSKSLKVKAGPTVMDAKKCKKLYYLFVKIFNSF